MIKNFKNVWYICICLRNDLDIKILEDFFDGFDNGVVFFLGLVFLLYCNYIVG